MLKFKISIQQKFTIKKKQSMDKKTYLQISICQDRFSKKTELLGINFKRV